MFTVEEPDEVLDKLKEYFDEQHCSITENSKKFKLRARCPVNEDEVTMNIRLEKVDENVNCIKLEKVSGDKMNYLTLYNDIKSYLTEIRTIL